MTSSQKEAQEPINASMDQQKFVCPWPGCGRLFRAQFSLNRHMVIHTDAKKYTCHICQRSFSLPQYLREHEYTHTKELPYVCGIAGCTMRFRQAGKLSLHRRTHAEYMPKKYDYSLNKDKRSRAKTKAMQKKEETGRKEKAGAKFKVTKIAGQIHSPDANDDTKALMTHHSHGLEDCQHNNGVLKPLPALSGSAQLCAHLNGHAASASEGRLEAAHYAMKCGDKLLPLLQCINAELPAGAGFVFPSATFNTPSHPTFSGLDLFALVKNYEH